MKIITYIIVLISTIVIFSCSSKKESNSESVVVEKNIMYNNISIDTITLDVNETSYRGFIKTKGDSIYFLDENYGWMYICDKDGRFMDRKLGMGEGPLQIPSPPSQFNFVGNDTIFVLGGQFDMILYDKKFNRIHRKVLNLENIISDTDNSVASIGTNYTIGYDKLCIGNSGNSMYISITPYAEKISDVSDEYYEESRIIGSLDYNNGNFDTLLGKISPIYMKNKYLPHFALRSFDVSNEDLTYVQEEIDSLIYVYNRKFELVSTFGLSGKNMNINYTTINNKIGSRELNKLYKEEHTSLGYYHQIKYIDELDYVVRIYTKGVDIENDGIQVYNDKNELIADIDIPKGISLSGYIAPYLYTNIVDSDTEELQLLRLQLLK